MIVTAVCDFVQDCVRVNMRATNLKIRDGLSKPSRNCDASSERVFWYPNPYPWRIVPRSRNGPQSELRGRARGMCVNSTIGFTCSLLANRFTKSTGPPATAGQLSYEYPPCARMISSLTSATESINRRVWFPIEVL